MQGPEIYLNDLGISVPCVVNPDEMAVLDEDHRVFLNWETYYLSDEKALKSFKETPYRYSGMVTDPVTRVRFQPEKNSPTKKYRDRLFYFSSEETAVEFATMPDSFATPKITMANK